MAPEQAEHRLGEVGRHTDVYALGVILYEMLAGQAPFTGTSDVETLKRIGARRAGAAASVAPRSAAQPRGNLP